MEGPLNMTVRFCEGQGISCLPEKPLALKKLSSPWCLFVSNDKKL